MLDRKNASEQCQTCQQATRIVNGKVSGGAMIDHVFFSFEKASPHTLSLDYSTRRPAPPAFILLCFFFGKRSNENAHYAICNSWTNPFPCASFLLLYSLTTTLLELLLDRFAKLPKMRIPDGWSQLL